MDFRGKTVIITGASVGIGAELAVALAKRGAQLVLASRSVPALEEVRARCVAAGGKAVVAETDVAEPDACRRMVETAVATYGGIDVLCNNAGLGMWARFEDVTDLSLFERVMRVNYLGAVYATHHALPHLKATRGLIVALSSLTGKTGVPTRTGYAASKHAMQGFFDSLRIELSESGVDVLVVSPGFVATDIRARALGADGLPLRASPREEGKNTMSVERCVAGIVRAMERRDRELVMPARARWGMWVKLIAPKVVDRIAALAVREK
jgi:short-subunit dehydrogenase